MPESRDHYPSQEPLRFNLRTLFAITFCLAVGLSCRLTPSEPSEGWWNLLGSLGEIFLASASMAIVIGLIQQTIFLTRHSTHEKHFFFEIGWRGAVAVLLTICLLIKMLVGRGYLTLPAWQGVEHMDYGLTSPTLILYACLLVVLGEYRYRFSPVSRKTPIGFWRFAFSFGVCVSLLLWILIDQTLIHSLVYLAIEGIERSQSLFYQRHGAYPNHFANGFWFFWRSFLATTCLTLGVAIWLWLLLYWKRSSFKRLAIVVAVTCLSFASWYGIWYYTTGLAEVSPELLEATFQGNWADWIGAIALLTIFITVAAVRIAKQENDSFSLSRKSIQHQPALHEVAFLYWLVLLAMPMIIVADFMLNFYTWYGWYYNLLDAIFNKGYYLPFALSVLSLQILWLRWRRRLGTNPIYPSVIDWRTFCLAWVSLILMLVISLPVLSAFCFCFWLGPWYLL